jgi:hypothetical protein
MSFPINVNIPAANDDPADDQPLMMANFANISGYVSVDHVAPGAVNNGFHKQSTYIPLASKPITVVGTVVALYAKTVAGLTQLFFEDQNLNETQLTFSKSIAANGYTILAGGLIVKWGSAGLTADATPIAFNATVAFTNVFSLTVSHAAIGAGEATQAIVSAASLTTTGFTLRVNGAASASYSYIAIGN